MTIHEPNYTTIICCLSNISRMADSLVKSNCYPFVLQFPRSCPHGSSFCCINMPSQKNETTFSPEVNGENHDESTNNSYVIATAAVLVVVMVIVALVLVYRMYHKRSGPLWITKFYVQDPYSSMRNDDSNPKDEQFIIGFANPIMESTTGDGDNQDGGVRVLGYKPLNTDKRPGENDDHLVQYKFLFPREKLVFGPEIGTGWFGKVYKGEAKRIVPGLRKTKVVIKKLMDNSTSQLRTRFVQEAEMLKSLDHKNVLGILGKATEKEPYMIVYEYSPMGNLKEFLISHKYDAASIKSKGIPLTMAIDIAAGLQYLHSSSIYYSDVAARNCVVDADLSVKIGDYGISRSLYENDYYKEPNSTVDSIPIRWIEPESASYLKDSGLTIKPPSSESNVWSYGVTVWEIIEFGRQPYEELTDEEVIQSVIIDRLYQLPEPKQTGNLASQLYETMRWCWVESPRRPSIQDMLTYLINMKENFSVSRPDEPSNLQQPVAIASNHNSEDNSTGLLTIAKKHNSDTKNNLESFSSTESCEVNNTCREEENNDDIEITDICDDDSVPITIINANDPEEQNIENMSDKPEIISSNSDLESEFGISVVTPPPVTYIGNPSDGIAEYDRRVAEGTQINPTNSGNEVVEVKYAGSNPSVIVENCASGYVVLPGELIRRKSSLRRVNAQSRGQSVHFPANILDLRVIHRYYKEEDEDVDENGDVDGKEDDDDENGHVLSRNTVNDDTVDKTEQESDSPVRENQDGTPAYDLLITGQTSEEPAMTDSQCFVVGRPTSQVEKKLRKGLRRKKLNQHSDEWLFSLNQER